MRFHFGKIAFLSGIFISCTFFSQAQLFNKSKDKTEDKEETLNWMEIDTLLQPIPINRQIFTENIQKSLKVLDLKDGKADKKLFFSDEERSKQLTKTFFTDVPNLIILIENLPKAKHQEKIAYHRAVQDMLKRFNQKNIEKTEIAYFSNSVKNLRNMIIAIENNTIKNFVKKEINSYSIDNSSVLINHPKEKEQLFESYGMLYPEEMIKRLGEFYNEPFADKIVAKAAYVDPTTIMIYATSTSILSNVVRRNTDPLVQTIVQIANQSEKPNRALAFLTDIHEKKRSIAEVDKLSDDPVEYFNALVSLKKDPKNKDNIALDKEIFYRGLQFVRVVNELHERPANIRFASLMEHSAEELYFMIIGGQDEIYTSSFTWMFDRLLHKMEQKSGDLFLESIHNSYFRTFIRMCSGYGTLEPFLNTMENEAQTKLMKAFVANLEKGPAEDLEDAVDVADAFGGLKNPEILDFLRKEVQKNYERTYAANNHESRKGVIIYGLLSTIFNHAEGNLNDNLNDVIPPITNIKNENLRNENGEVIQQVLFYGDDDGKMSYGRYVPLFQNGKWSIEQNQYWIKFTSKTKNKVIIYANKPLTEPEDEVAQRKLKEHFAKNNIEPTIVIHRGHSYFLPSTIENLTPSVKVVVLGSCGGYHNLGQVLDAAPDAHIISSKQVGALSVNVPITNAINDQLLAGKDLDWVNIWNGLDNYFKRQGKAQQELFNDYIPPNKNLGAIFIKAYRKLDVME